jgi:sugar phosphate isomerase/epimerase
MKHFPSTAGRRFTGIADEGGESLAAQLDCHRALGWNMLELRSIDGLPLARLGRQQLDAACAAIADAGFTVPVLDSQIGNWRSDITDAFAADVEELALLARLARPLGSRLVRIMSYPNQRPDEALDDAAWQREVFRRLGLLTRQAADQGLVLVHENCSGWGGQTLAHTLRLLDAVDHPSLQLLFDLGNGPAYGYEAGAWLAQVWPRVVHVHVKDALRDAAGQVRYTFPGEGSCGVREGMAFLHARGYAGLWSIEPHLALIPHLQAERGEPRADAYLAYARSAMALFEQVCAAHASEPAHAV